MAKSYCTWSGLAYQISTLSVANKEECAGSENGRYWIKLQKYHINGHLKQNKTNKPNLSSQS